MPTKADTGGAYRAQSGWRSAPLRDGSGTLAVFSELANGRFFAAHIRIKLNGGLGSSELCAPGIMCEFGLEWATLFVAQTLNTV